MIVLRFSIEIDKVYDSKWDLEESFMYYSVSQWWLITFFFCLQSLVTFVFRYVGPVEFILTFSSVGILQTTVTWVTKRKFNISLLLKTKFIYILPDIVCLRVSLFILKSWFICGLLLFVLLCWHNTLSFVSTKPVSLFCSNLLQM